MITTKFMAATLFALMLFHAGQTWVGYSEPAPAMVGQEVTK